MPGVRSAICRKCATKSRPSTGPVVQCPANMWAGNRFTAGKLRVLPPGATQSNTVGPRGHKAETRGTVELTLETPFANFHFSSRLDRTFLFDSLASKCRHNYQSPTYQ